LAQGPSQGRLARQLCRITAGVAAVGQLTRLGHAPAHVVEADVRGQPPEPGFERPRRVIAAEVAIEMDEDLLGYVLGFAGVANVLVGEAINPALVAADQLFERLAIAAARQPGELDRREPN